VVGGVSASADAPRTFHGSVASDRTASTSRLREVLNRDSLSHRVWYSTLAQVKLQSRDLYQCRHTFAWLILQ
jgi:hypothetical protein